MNANWWRVVSCHSHGWCQQESVLDIENIDETKAFLHLSSLICCFSALLSEVFCARFLATSQLNYFKKDLGAVLQSYYL